MHVAVSVNIERVSEQGCIDAAGLVGAGVYDTRIRLASRICLSICPVCSSVREVRFVVSHTHRNRPTHTLVLPQQYTVWTPVQSSTLTWFPAKDCGNNPGVDLQTLTAVFSVHI